MRQLDCYIQTHYQDTINVYVYQYMLFNLSTEAPVLGVTCGVTRYISNSLRNIITFVVAK